MTGGTHTLAGTTAGLALGLGLHFPPAPALALALFAALGALLPDIDHPASTVGRRFRLLSVPTGWLFHHRGFTHSLAALALVTAAGVHYGGVYGVALGIGYATHLITDGMTKSGLMLLWPFPALLHLLPRGLRLTTGGRLERLIFFMLTSLTGWLIWRCL